MAGKPTRDFGTRKPAEIRPAQPVKRGHVALLLMGTLAVGGGAYALMPGENCDPNRPGIAAPFGVQTSTACGSRGHATSGSRIGSRSGFFSSDSSSSHASSGTSSPDSNAGHVTRGGFGGFAHAFGSHFSGGG
jgi:hypothetical protein